MCISSRYILLALTLAVTYCLCAFAQLHTDVTTNPVKPPAAKRPAPGTARTNPKDGLKYVWIPAGTFMMGCSPGDKECFDWEKPAHQVTITRGFWLGQTEVTVGAYKRFAVGTGKDMPSAPDFNQGWSNERMPIVKVTQNEARDYCGWAGGRLPTEAEWEYASRAGSTEARYGALDDIAWYGENSGNEMHPVAEKRSNGFGLYDMLGNVDEWVNDWYQRNYYENSPSQNPVGPLSGQFQALRGTSGYLSADRSMLTVGVSTSAFAALG